MALVRPSKGPISAKGAYGWRQLPNEKVTWHDGMDFVGALGSQVKAASSGVVVASAPNGQYDRYGNVVVIKHDDPTNGAYSLYAHLSERKVSKGQRVKAGQLIGKMGNVAATKVNPAKTVNTHLHFELLKRFPLPPPDTDRIDPTPLIVAGANPASTYESSPLMYEHTSPLMADLGEIGESQFEKLNNAIYKAAPRSEHFSKLAVEWNTNVFEPRTWKMSIPFLWHSLMVEYLDKYTKLYKTALTYGGASDKRLTDPRALEITAGGTAEDFYNPTASQAQKIASKVLDPIASSAGNAAAAGARVQIRETAEEAATAASKAASDQLMATAKQLAGGALVIGGIAFIAFKLFGGSRERASQRTAP